MPKFIEASKAEDGDTTSVGGYRVWVVNAIEHSPRNIGVYVKAGSYGEQLAPICSNYASIETGDVLTPDPEIVTYRIFRPALLALAETFGTTWCNAYPRDLLKLWKDFHFRSGWINYVAPRFAPLVAPPTSAIVEVRPDGGLLMSATDEVFSVDNPQHMAVAQEIQAALAPLNALPWPPNAEPEDWPKNGPASSHP